MRTYGFIVILLAVMATGATGAFAQTTPMDWNAEATEAGVATVGGVKMTASPASDFDFDAETKTITGYHGPGGDVVIPDLIVVYGGDVHYPGNPVGGEAYHGVIVREIGVNAFRNNTGIRSIVVPDGVWTVNNYAFGYCSNLLTAVMGASLNYIGEGAFAYTGMQHLVLRCPAPPTAPANPFIGMYIYGVTLHIRAGTKAAYTAAGWGAFQAVIEDIATEVFTVCISDTIRDTIYGSAIIVHDTTLCIHVIRDTVEHVVTLDSIHYKGYTYVKDTDTILMRYTEYVYDTVYLTYVAYDDTIHKDTVIYDRTFHRDTIIYHYDTTRINVTIRDTTHDTTRIDTTIIDNEYHKDTVIYNYYYKDTVIDNIYHKDTTIYKDTVIYVFAYDTARKVFIDSLLKPVTIYRDTTYTDTLWIDVHDTLHIYHDTTWTDTLRVPVHDTIIYEHDVYLVRYDTIYRDTLVQEVHDTLWKDTLTVYDTIVEEHLVYVVLDPGSTPSQVVVSEDARAVSVGGDVVLEGLTGGTDYAVYSISGMLVVRAAVPVGGTVVLRDLQSGVYLLHHGGSWKKFGH